MGRCNACEVTGFIPTSEKGAVNGVAELDSAGKGAVCATAYRHHRRRGTKNCKKQALIFWIKRIELSPRTATRASHRNGTGQRLRPSGAMIAVVSLLASAGSEAGNLTITVNDGTSDVWSCILTLTANNAAFLDSKIFLPAAYILKAEGSVDGIKVMVSADDSEV